MNKAVITGANGFVGSSLIKELLKHDVEVIAVYHKKRDNIPNNVRAISCDLSCIGDLAEQINEPSIDAFYHLAWSGATGQARTDYSLQLCNAKFTVDAVRIAALLNCKKFIGIGSLAEFDCNLYTPMDGATPNMVSCYGTAKIAANYMSKAAATQLKIEHIWVRLSNVYGVGDQSDNFINFAVHSIQNVPRPKFTSGEQLYDFVYISDVAEGLYLIGERGSKQHSYFLGSGKPRPLKEYIYDIRNKIDTSKKLLLGAIPFNGQSIPGDYFSCDKLINEIGFRPKVTFGEGIEKML